MRTPQPYRALEFIRKHRSYPDSMPRTDPGIGASKTLLKKSDGPSLTDCQSIVAARPVACHRLFHP